MTIVRQVRRGIRGKGREWESGVRWDRWESGTCVDGHLSYHCVCNVGWTGGDCETGKEGEGEQGREWQSGVRWDRWESGTCVDGHLSYHCVCDVRWTGDDCETGKEGDKGKE